MSLTYISNLRDNFINLRIKHVVFLFIELWFESLLSQVLQSFNYNKQLYKRAINCTFLIDIFDFIINAFLDIYP